MRITESFLLNNANVNNATSASNFELYQQELSTGRKINVPSDDPVGVGQALALRTSLTDIAQYQTNATTAEAALSTSDSALNSVNNLLQQARQIALAAANSGTLTATDTQAYAGQIDSILTEVTNVANTEYNGRYIFAGQQVHTAPYSASDPTHAYAGDNGTMAVTIGANQSVTTNTPGSQIFASIFTALEGLKANVLAGSATAISNTDLANIDAASSGVLVARAQIGGSVNQVKDVQSQLTATQGKFQEYLSNLEDADLATTYANMQVAQNVYQASLTATSKALQFSLADYLH